MGCCFPTNNSSESTIRGGFNINNYNNQLLTEQSPRVRELIILKGDSVERWIIPYDSLSTMGDLRTKLAELGRCPESAIVNIILHPIDIEEIRRTKGRMGGMMTQQAIGGSPNDMNLCDMGVVPGSKILFWAINEGQAALLAGFIGNNINVMDMNMMNMNKNMNKNIISQNGNDNTPNMNPYIPNNIYKPTSSNIYIPPQAISPVGGKGGEKSTELSVIDTKQGGITLNILTTTGTNFHVNILPAHNGRDLKEKIAKFSGEDVNSVHLRYLGEVVNEDETLFRAGITSSCSISCHFGEYYETNYDNIV